MNFCHIADLNFKLSGSEVRTISEMITKSFGTMKFETLREIIMNGIKGYYDREGYQLPINSRTIFMWIDRYMDKHPYACYTDEEKKAMQ